ncbi:hypothetical protein N9057_07170, partial [Akkermansiaceae bacterium]|nr:hypothetical protein [Akkermansiaceae bacterium]
MRKIKLALRRISIKSLSGGEIKINLVAFAYSQAVSLFLLFAQIPLFLFFWGKQLYGEWLVLTGPASVLALLDFGVSKASESRALARCAKNNWTDTRSVIHTAQAYTLCAISLVLTLGLVITFLPWDQILNLEDITNQSAITVLMAMVITVGVSLQLGIVDARFKVAGRTPLGVFLLSNRRIATFIGFCIVLLLGFGPSVAAIVWACVDLFFLFAVSFICRKCTEHQLHGWKLASRREFFSVIKPSTSYLLFPLASVITLQGGIQFLNILSGSRAVVDFSIVRTLVRTILQVGIVINNSIKPVVSRLAGSGKYKEIIRIKNRTNHITKIIGLISLVALWTTGPALVKFWTHGEVQVTRVFVIFLASHSVINLILVGPVAVDMALNRHGAILRVLFGSSIISLAFWIAFQHLIT